MQYLLMFTIVYSMCSKYVGIPSLLSLDLIDSGALIMLINFANTRCVVYITNWQMSGNNERNKGIISCNYHRKIELSLTLALLINTGALIVLTVLALQIRDVLFIQLIGKLRTIRREVGVWLAVIIICGW